MPKQQPLNEQQKCWVKKATEAFITQGSELFEHTFSFIPVTFDLIGRSAGMYRCRQHERQIRYNSYLFAKFFDENLAETVPHEVAHYLTDVIYGYQNVKAHGKEWQNIMHAFGVEPKVRCRFDMQGIPRRQLKYVLYQCDCQTHQLSSIRHKRVLQQGVHYFCKRCNGQLVAVTHV